MSLLVALADLPIHEGVPEKVIAAISILRVILRIDFELLGPLLQDVLTKLLMVCRNANFARSLDSNVPKHRLIRHGKRIAVRFCERS